MKQIEEVKGYINEKKRKDTAIDHSCKARIALGCSIAYIIFPVQRKFVEFSICYLFSTFIY